MIGTIDDPRITVGIGQACGAAARRVRDRIEASHKREERREAASREDSFTDDLADDIDAIGTAVEHEIASIADRLGPLANTRVEFRSQKAPQGEDSKFGLDLGVRVIVSTPGYSADKAILVQCKRMRGVGAKGRFPKLRDDGEKQAAQMLSITPASFFFLFNNGSLEELLDLLQMSAAVPVLWSDTLRSVLLQAEYIDPHITVLPATRVLSMSLAAKAAGTKLPVDAKSVLAGGIPFGHFMAGLFAPCIVGDVRSPVVRLATAPTLRSAPVAGLDADVPPLDHLSARHFYELAVSQDMKP